MKKYKITKREDEEFALNSSLIEGEYSDEAIQDSLLAWNYLKGVKKLTFENIMNCHKILQHRLRPDIAGKIRLCNVRVGMHVAPHYTEVKELLDNWLKWWNAPTYDFKNMEDMLKLSHVEFETIHPFEDGNGRVGRCILNWHRINNGLAPVIIHPGHEQFAYYKWFDNKKINGKKRKQSR